VAASATGAAVAWESLVGRLALLLQPFQEVLLLLLLLLLLMMMVVGHGSLAVCEPVVGQNVIAEQGSSIAVQD
jgi:hypothetical protein